MLFTDGVFFSLLHKNLNLLRLDDTFCDVTLIANSIAFRVHKTILVASSPYFRAMFLSKAFKEHNDEVIDLKNIHHAVLSEILNFMYTSMIEISEDTIYLLMAAVDMLQLTSLRICITNFLMSKMSVSSCLSIYGAASSSNFHDLSEIAYSYCLKNFHTIIQQDTFKDLSVQVLLSFISSKLLNVPSEDGVLEALLVWVNVKPEERKPYLPELLKHVNLQHVSCGCLLSAKTSLLPLNEPEIVRMIDEVIDDVSENIGNVPSWQYSRIPRMKRIFRYHLEQEAMLAIGGECREIASRHVECYTTGYESWKCVMPEYLVMGRSAPESRVISAMRCARMDAASAHDRYNVYVIGGRTSRELLNSCEAYDVDKNNWRSLPSLPMPLEGCSAALCDGRIVVTGGKGSNSAWELDPKWKAWKALPPLPEPRHHHCTIAAHGFVFVLGGHTTCEEKPAATVLRYDLLSREWTELPDMKKRRAWFGAVAMDSCIYVMGGLAEGIALRDAEKYDMIANEWVTLSDMPTPRYYFSATICNSRIICIGGNDSVHVLHTVIKYNPKTDRWHSFNVMQMTRVGLCCATVCIPVLDDVSR